MSAHLPLPFGLQLAQPDIVDLSPVVTDYLKHVATIKGRLAWFPRHQQHYIAMLQPPPLPQLPPLPLPLPPARPPLQPPATPVRLSARTIQRRTGRNCTPSGTCMQAHEQTHLDVVVLHAMRNSSGLKRCRVAPSFITSPRTRRGQSLGRTGAWGSYVCSRKRGMTVPRSGC